LTLPAPLLFAKIAGKHAGNLCLLSSRRPALITFHVKKHALYSIENQQFILFDFAGLWRYFMPLKLLHDFCGFKTFKAKAL
jgi:hypothetical protein